jgi:hypothetical protein
MLSHLPLAVKQFLLSVYNRIWTESVVPDASNGAIVMPVLKPGRDRSQATTYRPTSLTSRLCKTTECMVNRRLVWILKSRNPLSGARCGFRQHRSALDHLLKLEYYKQNASLLCQHLVAAFLDQKKASDTTWRYGILGTIHRWSMRGRLPLFLSHFLQARYFRVRLGNILSARYPQENGVRKGSVLSATLFAISISGR